MNKGKLYLIPSPISDDTPLWVGEEIRNCILHTKYYAVERAKTARKFLKLMQPLISLPDLNIVEFDKDNPENNIEEILSPLLSGNDMGLMSEAGNPCIADPGSILVAKAHKHEIEVIPLIGPSSILLALISSGFNGQNFVFHGYLPNKKEQLIPKLKSLESIMIKLKQTQIFMETPYRNLFLIETMLQNLTNDVLLSIGCNLGSEKQMIKTLKISQWRFQDLSIYHKNPCIFTIGNTI
ncbi:MAG: hypothetical protein RLZZ546_3342 [Bacteroidota bacterium]